LASSGVRREYVEVIDYRHSLALQLSVQTDITITEDVCGVLGVRAAVFRSGDGIRKLSLAALNSGRAAGALDLDIMS
jgi:hypothetical protein